MARKAQAVFRDESLANLRPREPIYGEAKKRRELMATDEGWAGLKALAAAHGLSLSELCERLGRGTLSLGDALGDELQGDLLTVTEWGIDFGHAVDSQGRRYAVKREKESP
jgi:hypothetical protein